MKKKLGIKYCGGAILLMKGWSNLFTPELTGKADVWRVENGRLEM